jgi:hypothetical protein
MRCTESNHLNLKQQQLDASIAQVAAELRSWGGIVVIGAGLSVFSGMPLANGLNALVWHALDCDIQARRDLAQQLGEPDAAAKTLVGDEASRIARAYATIRKYANAREAFQRGFVQRNEERNDQPSMAHEALARLFHRGFVELVVSENWDTLFEGAYERLYGRRLTPDDQFFFKPHGDAAHPEAPRVLPDERGQVPDALERRLNQFTAERPRLLLIVGYAEGDEEVVKKLIEPLAARWRVGRIGPSAQGELAVGLPADVAIPKLLAAVDPRPAISPWAPVKFGQQHGLGPALSGEGLGPLDIEALPALPETAAVVARIRATHRATLSGDSGCGKSGTAYRVARHFHDEGYEIVRLADASSPLRDQQAALEARRFRTFALIDDAHRLDPSSLTELMDAASSLRPMLAVMTAGQPTGRDEIRIDNKRAVSIIAATLSTQRARTLALVHALDSHVGDGYGNELLERRIEHAAEQPSPWQFTFVLTGGWHRVGQHVVNARAAARADLLLLAIATYQLVTEDGAAGQEDLIRAAAVFGFDAAWVQRALQTLSRLRLIASAEQPKCVHLRYATVVVKASLQDRSDELRAPALAFLDAVLREPRHRLRGQYWLLDALRFTDGLWGKRKEVLSAETRSVLISRSFGAETPYDRSVAGYLLSVLDDFAPDWADVLNAHVDDLSRFVRDADGTSGWGLARLLNDIDRDYHAVVNRALAAVDAAHFATKIEQTSVETLAGFAKLLDRIAYIGRDGFASSLRATWSSDKIRKLAKESAAQNTYAFGEFVDAVNHIDKELAFAIVDENAEALAAAFADEPVGTYENLTDILWFVLSFDMGLGIVPAPSAPQRKLGRSICKDLDPTYCARAIEAGRLGDLERWARLLYFVKRADPTRAKKVYDELSFERIDEWSAPLWSDPPIDLEHFVMTAAFKPDYEPARSWITRHQDDLRRIPPRLVIIAPEAAAHAMRRGADLAYPENLGLSWEEFVAALTFLAQVDKELAARSIRGQINMLAKSLMTHQANLYEKVDKFLPHLEEMAPGIEGDVFAHIDPQLASKHWPQLLKGKPAQRRAAKYLLEAAAKYGGRVGDIAVKLRDQAGGAHRSDPTKKMMCMPVLPEDQTTSGPRPQSQCSDFMKRATLLGLQLGPVRNLLATL